MTAPHILNPAALLEKGLSDASPDLMRHLLSTVINALLSAEADAVCGTGYVHSVTATAANVHDLDEAHHLVRDDDEVAYADAGYQGAAKRPTIKDDEHRSQIEWRIAARKGKLKTMSDHDRAEQSRQAGVRAKVEHPFLIVKRDFGFTKTRYRGIAKNLNHLHLLFASANWLMRARAVALTPAAA